MIRKRRETKAEKLNNKIREIVQEITNDKKHYSEYKAIIGKLNFISAQVNLRITNELYENKNKE